MPPKPTKILDTYWKFATKRQDIFIKKTKITNNILPNDSILAEHRFTNVFRITDRVSQYLVKEIQYNPKRSQQPQEIFYRTILFKIFNKIETWEALERKLGLIQWDLQQLKEIEKTLEMMRSDKRVIYSAAYIMASPKYGKKYKHQNHLALLKEMMEDNLPAKLQQLTSLKDVYEKLSTYKSIGSFLAFQLTIDLNYSTLINFDENSFVIAGPGALDGISKCFAYDAKLTPEDIIYWVTENQEKEFKRLNLNFQTLFGRRLQPIDCQNIFCEVSKYTRVSNPEVIGISGRTRIKQKYKAKKEPLPPLFFPPKWKLNIPKGR